MYGNIHCLGENIFGFIHQLYVHVYLQKEQLETEFRVMQKCCWLAVVTIS